VQGHIDEVGKLNKATLSNDFGLLEVTFSPEFAPLLVEKGAITIDGISLTIASLGPTSFTCQIIPHTWQNTTLKTKKANDTVNLEYDILGKYLHRFHTLKSTTSDQSLMQTLQNSGFL
jgi:riboflavin synthase